MKCKLISIFILMVMFLSSCEKIDNLLLWMVKDLGPFYTVGMTILDSRRYARELRDNKYEKDFEFPDNIPPKMHLGIIDIPDPIMIVVDTAKYYITSRRCLDSLTNVNPDTSRLCLELNTEKYSEYWKTYYPRSSYERNRFLRKYCENYFTWEGMFDKVEDRERFTVYQFILPPYGFLLSYEPVSGSYYKNRISKQIKLVVLPLYTHRQQTIILRSNKLYEQLQQSCDWEEPEYTDVFVDESATVDTAI